LPNRTCKTVFFRHLYIKMMILPRQARDKHRENSKTCVRHHKKTSHHDNAVTTQHIAAHSTAQHKATAQHSTAKQLRQASWSTHVSRTRGPNSGVMTRPCRPYSPSPACEKRHSFLNFSYVCPEPVLVKRCILYINGARSGVFRTFSAYGIAKAVSFIVGSA
jgi:hypothetical protein